MNWLDKVCEQLTAICDAYEKTAPTVTEWANDLYIRINEKPDEVRLSELNMVGTLAPCDLAANYAANTVYKLMNRLGQDTTGHAGF